MAVDFDLYGVVGVRLTNASAGDVSALSLQLQSRPEPLRREPDIIIQFEDELQAAELNYLGADTMAFADDRFLLLDTRTGAIDAQIPFDAIGTQCALVCRRGLASVPLLADIVSMAFISKGYVALHGSAFACGNAGILVVGWEKGGKTEALLSFVKHGAQFVGDETILVSTDGTRMLGVPRPISVWEWQFQFLEGLLPKIGVSRKAIFACIRMLGGLHRRIRTSRLARWQPFAALDKAMPTLRRQLRNWYWPSELFADRVCEDAVALDKIFLVASQAGADLEVETCATMDIAARMRNSNDFERSHFFQYYRAFKFAFPDRRNDFLEQLDERQAAALPGALADKPAYRVTHPYPVSLEALYAAMRPYVQGNRT